MRIIDEKGRLFGKINLIDFLVIVILVSLWPMLHFGYKILTEKPTVEIAPEPEPEPEPEKKLVEMVIDCLLIKVEPEVAKIISVGDKELDENEQVIGEIVSVGKVSPYTYKFNIGSGQKFIMKVSDLKQVPVILKIKAELRQDNLYYKDKQILENSTFDFKTDRYQTEGVFLFKLKTGPDELTLPQQIAYIEKKIENLHEVTDKGISTLSVNQDRMNNKVSTLENKVSTLKEKIDTIMSSPKIKRLMKKR